MSKPNPNCTNCRNGDHAKCDKVKTTLCACFGRKHLIEDPKPAKVEA